MDIKIPTKAEHIFEQYLHILNPVLGTKKLTDMEIIVLSKLLYIQFLYKHMPEEQQNLIIFHKETKKRIRQQIQESKKIIMSDNSFNNLMYKLKVKGFITGKSILHKVPLVKNTINLNYVLFYE